MLVWLSALVSKIFSAWASHALSSRVKCSCSMVWLNRSNRSLTGNEVLLVRREPSRLFFEKRGLAQEILCIGVQVLRALERSNRGITIHCECDMGLSHLGNRL